MQILVASKVSPKMIGLALNILLINNMKLGHKMTMADEKDIEVLINTLKKWSEISQELKAVEDRVDEISQMDFGL